MKPLIKYCLLILLLASLCGSCNKYPGLPSLKETFAKKDKIPFGCYVFYQQIQLLFNRNYLQDSKENFESLWQDKSDTTSLYISVSKNLFLSAEGEKAMLDYVNSGNTIFISSENIDSTLLDSLSVKASTVKPMSETTASLKYTGLAVDTAFFKQANQYNYFYFPYKNYFTNFDSVNTAVLGINELGKPNLLKIYYGKGLFYLQCEPRAFSNYFLLQNKNYQYLQKVFAFTNMEPEHIYWDDYYNKKNRKPSAKDSKSGLSLLLQYPPMAWAFWLLFLLLVVYILFGGKRRQRIVATIAPNVNTTVAFTETVGQLYLQKKDNRNIADKMIKYFQEQIRKQYFLNTNQLSDDFLLTLSKKSNVTYDAVIDLFNLINMIQQLDNITDEQLLLLNHRIENFYKNKI